MSAPSLGVVVAATIGNRTLVRSLRPGIAGIEEATSLVAFDRQRKATVRKTAHAFFSLLCPGLIGKSLCSWGGRELFRPNRIQEGPPNAIRTAKFHRQVEYTG